MKFNNLILTGTSHIAQQSIDEITKLIDRHQPAIITLELDRDRFHALFQEQKQGIQIRDIFKVGVKGFLFALLGGWASKKLGEQVGVMPGAEMKKAAEIARAKDIKIALVDQHIQKTLQRLSKSITWKEKGRFLIDLLKGLIFRKPEIQFDLTTVPSEKVIEQLIGHVKKRYPSLYRVLILERNVVMAKKLFKLQQDHPDDTILAFVGAGHVKGMGKLLEQMHNSH
ncbi:MAG: TraB/GumN family protein [Nanoarchaeota archaeon]|nr:TraB/GumN family protein [Nanoarchaeota archaeon]